MSNILTEKIKPEHLKKIENLNNSNLNALIEEILTLCNPSKVFVCDDSDEDKNYIRQQAIETGEEKQLKLNNQTIHFDNYKDQARDKANTKILIENAKDFAPNLNSKERDDGLNEVKEILKNSMVDKELIIRFFSLGPSNSDFTIPAVQFTDSFYVSHSEGLLYREGYSVFENLKNKKRFLRFIHSQGELENAVSKNLDKRRIYIDRDHLTSYSTNTQYGGNSLGLKKMAMRFTIYLASREGWLTEHMFLMGVNGPDNRVSFFTGAFPSGCGKTSTSMITGEKIVGDDITYLKRKNGKIYAVNVEKGMFGIIEGVNPDDDPIIWKRLHENKEIIFSNVLIDKNNNPYWTGSGLEEPKEGINFSGQWQNGKKDENDKLIPPSYKNARFTLSLDTLENCDENLHNPEGLPVSGIIYGGRDSDISVPVEQSFDWKQGIIWKGASLESETTAATLGQEGVRKFNPMSNLDFLSVPISQYIDMNVKFAEGVDKLPMIFSVNYFLRDKNGEFLNEKTDKNIWLKWMELRVHNEVEALETPSGFIPKYEDLHKLFKSVLNKEYPKANYEQEFTIRIPENLDKIDRIEKIFKEKIPGASELIFSVLNEQKKKFQDFQSRLGDYISPFKL